MKKSSTLSLLVLTLLFGRIAPSSASDLHIARIGDFPLENGQTILDCRIGYRTFGKLSPERDNAILYPTWFLGRSEQLQSLVGPDKFVDTTRYYVIAVDALGNGVSSSPSNSARQPQSAFPEITIYDMVRSQHRFLTKVLKINHLYGIIGGSMGGMQVFQWIVSFPEFIDRAIAYVGTPQMTTFDLLLWQSELAILENGRLFQIPSDRLLKQLVMLQTAFMRTPEYYVKAVPPEQYDRFMSRSLAGYRANFHPANWACQLRAMIHHDIYGLFNGDKRKAAGAIRARLLVIVGQTDHVVNPQPALELAELAKAETMVLENNCGHGCVGCEFKRVAQRIRAFWEEP